MRGANGVAFALDLTERNRLEAERTLRVQAQTANQAQGRVPGGRVPRAPHAPGRGVEQRAHAAHGGLGARRSPSLDRIDRSTQLQARLVDDLLDASKIVAGKLQVDKTPVPLPPIVAARRRAAAEANAKGAARAGLEAAPALVLGDAERLQQIALDLIANAIKFTPSAGHVEVSLASRAGHAVLTVRDTGVASRRSCSRTSSTDSGRATRMDVIKVSAWGSPSSGTSWRPTGEGSAPRAPDQTRAPSSSSSCRCTTPY